MTRPDGIMEPAILRGSAQPERATAERCAIAELANGPGDPALSIARARVAPGVVTQWHRLRGIDERYVILEGHGRVEVGELPATAVAPGDVVRIPAGVRQRIANVGTADLVFLALCTPRFVPEAYEAADTGA